MATDTSGAGALWDAGVRNPLGQLHFRVRVYPDRFFTGGEDEGYFARNAVFTGSNPVARKHPRVAEWLKAP